MNVVIKAEVGTEWKGRTRQIGSLSLGSKRGRYSRWLKAKCLLRTLRFDKMALHGMYYCLSQKTRHIMFQVFKTEWMISNMIC